VRQLLPYWGFPGLYLLLFVSQYEQHIKLAKLFPVLIEHGGVPQGTELYRALHQCIDDKCLHNPLYRDTFNTMHGKIQ
jgi:hypothetical protein